MRYYLSLLLSLVTGSLFAQQKTYCNPINIDYGYVPTTTYTGWGNHRTSADPAIVNYKGDYYLFPTNQKGYWWSSDMSEWHFVSRSFLTDEIIEHDPTIWDDICAPAVWVQGDSLCVYGSTHTSRFPIWISTNPKKNEWSKGTEHFELGGWDPAFFVDDDNRLYMYNGCSNDHPIYGVELDRKTFRPLGERKELITSTPEKVGWHRFGEYNDNVFLKPFMEGAWMTNHNGKYYLQWAGPGTEFGNYSDGVAIADNPLGPFTHVSLPYSAKAGGFIQGAGHGATFLDNWNNYWHTATMVINVKNKFERRIGIWPAGFDKEGVMYCNTAFGDYPHYLPDGAADHLKSRFTGWMLLNYNKPVRVSSVLGSYQGNNLVDESIKTYWSAATGDKGEWLISDLGEASIVHAVQINYADQDAEFLGKQLDIYHQYMVYYSLDGENWKILIDKSKNKKDVPHDYVELTTPVKARYLKMVNIHMPTGKFAISGFRVFGIGSKEKPKQIKEFFADRAQEGQRFGVWLKWTPSEDAYAYNIYIGTEPDKLYNSVMVYNANEYYYTGMDATKPYYFAIEAINENGTSPRTTTQAR